MITLLPRILLCTLLLLAQGLLTAQTTPAEVVEAMGRGINLGNTLEPPLEGFWNNGPAEEAYFDAYVEAGFTNVRVPVRWDMHTQQEAPFTVDSAWMDRVEEVIDWGLERELYITLNAHHEDWLKEDYGNDTLRARFDSIWVQVADRFADKSDSLLFEIINEPFGMTVAEVDDLNQRVLSIIRRSNPDRMVVFGGNAYSNVDELLAAAVPDDENLIAYFHAYDPYSFAGEARGTWGTDEDYAALAERFARVATWSDSTGVPIYLSEFGAVLQADYNSRMRFYAAYTENAVRHGFAFAVWDDGGMFRILDRDSLTWPPVKDVLINTYLDSPTDFTVRVADTTEDGQPAVTLNWTNRDTLGGIFIQRAVNDGKFTTLAIRSVGTTSYVDRAVSAGNFYSYRISLRRSDRTVLQSYPQRVLLPGVQSPFGAKAFSVSDTIQAEDFDLGGEEVAYHDQERDNIPGEYRPDEGVDIGSNGAGGFAVGYIARGEWLEYTIDVPEAGTYSMLAAAASEVDGGALRLSTSGGTSTLNLAVAATGGFDSFASFTSPGTIDLPAGEQIVRIDFTADAPFNLDYFLLQAAAEDRSAIVNYADRLDTALNRFSGEPVGLSYAVANGAFTLVGDGTAGQYQTVRYDLPDTVAADVRGSDNLLFVRARTTKDGPLKLRIDLVDEADRHTTLAGEAVDVAGAEYATYRYDFTGAYTDGGYGGTGCPVGSQCPVDGDRIVALTFYPDPEAGAFADSLVIDYLAFGEPLEEPVVTSKGVPDYRELFDDGSASFAGEPSGITFAVDSSQLSITGDGTALPFQNFTYLVGGDSSKADVVASSNTLFLRARLTGADSARLRIDLVDERGYLTSLDSRSVDVTGDSFAIYSIDYTDAYRDGGFGGTPCNASTAPCAVDGERIVALVLYPDADTGGFAGTIDIDYLSFGVEINTATRDFAELAGFRVFPNPTDETLYFSYRLETVADLTVELYDTKGRRILRQRERKLPAGDGTYELPVAGLAAGQYYLSLRIGDRPVRGRTVIIR